MRRRRIDRSVTCAENLDSSRNTEARDMLVNMSYLLMFTLLTTVNRSGTGSSITLALNQLVHGDARLREEC